MDTNFIFSCSTRYLTRSLRSLVRYRVEHSKIKFVSTRGHVISSICTAGCREKLHNVIILSMLSVDWLAKEDYNSNIQLNTSIYSNNSNFQHPPTTLPLWHIVLCLVSRDGAVVRVLASHQCGPGLIPGLGITCGLSLLLVIVLAARGFSLGASVFPYPPKKKSQQQRQKKFFQIPV